MPEPTTTVAAANAERARRRARRSRLRWLPAIAILIVVAAALIATVAIGQSWWAAPRPTAAVDQIASDGTSTFTTTGRQFATRDGNVRVKLGPSALDASRLGLAEGTTEVAFEVPVELRIVAPEGVVALPGMSGLTIEVDGDRVRSVAGHPSPGESFSGTVMPLLRALAPRTGWTDAQFAELENGLAAGGSAAGSSGYSAGLGPGDALGVDATARVDVDPTGGVTAWVRFATD